MLKVISCTYHCLGCGAQLSRVVERVRFPGGAVQRVHFWKHPETPQPCVHRGPDGIYLEPEQEGETHADGFLPTPA